MNENRERESDWGRERRIDQEGERDRNLKEISRRHKKKNNECNQLLMMTSVWTHRVWQKIMSA